MRGRPRINPTVRSLISSRARKDTGIKRRALAHMLTNEIIEMGEIPPTEETMLKLISEARNLPYDKLDLPWRISTLPDYPIPPESLPKVLEIFIEKLREQAVHITIQEAQWIGRLAFVVQDNERLWQNALNYAWGEKALKASHLEYTDIGDDLLLYGDMPGKAQPLGSDFDFIRKQVNMAESKRKLEEIKYRKKEKREKVSTSVVAHLDGVQIYPPKESNQKEAKQ